MKNVTPKRKVEICRFILTVEEDNELTMNYEHRLKDKMIVERACQSVCKEILQTFNPNFIHEHVADDPIN